MCFDLRFWIVKCPVEYHPFFLIKRTEMTGIYKRSADHFFSNNITEFSGTGIPKSKLKMSHINRYKTRS